MKSTAKAEAIARDLKERLEFRGFAVTESKDAEGFPKLTLDADASIDIQGADAVSKDVFGNDLKSFAPHFCRLSVDDATVGATRMAKIMADLVKIGIDKILVKEATGLATAEAVADSAAEVIASDVLWPSKGI